MGKKDRKTMDTILVVIASVLFVFVVAMTLIYIHTGGIPDTLCTCVFATCGGECGVMGWIKTTKDRHRERRYEIEDREHNEKLKDAGSHADPGEEEVWT